MAESDVKNFIVNYEDGSRKVVEKGFFCEFKGEDAEQELTFNLVHISGKDLGSIVLGCIQLGDEMHLFDNLKEKHRSIEG